LADRFAAMSLSGMRGRGSDKILRAAEYAQAKVRVAEKFVFDPEASHRVGTVIRDIPDLLVEQIQFARAPFDLCWIEYDVEQIFKVLNPTDTNPNDATQDKLLGILVNHNRIVEVIEDIRGHIGFLPFVYHLNTEWLIPDQLRFCEMMGVSRLGIDHWLWGSVANKFRDQGKQDYLRLLRDTTMVEPLLPSEATDDKQQMALMLHGTTGDFKNHLAVLLLLNQPSVTQYIRIPPTRGWIGNKPKPFMAHNTVRVALDPIPNIVLLSEGHGEGDLRRRHRVRGHYCQNEAARTAARHRNCIHEWQAASEEWEIVAGSDEPMPDSDINHWICSGCHGRRWWRAQHERGDASKGFIDHTHYDVRP
jgi:hypothetical protein